MARLTGLVSALGALAVALWGAQLGGAVQDVLTAALGLGSVVALHEHHANQRALTHAAVQVGNHESMAQHVAHAVYTALAELLASDSVPVHVDDTAAAHHAGAEVTPPPPGATVPPQS